MRVFSHAAASCTAALSSSAPTSDLYKLYNLVYLLLQGNRSGPLRGGHSRANADHGPHVFLTARFTRASRLWRCVESMLAATNTETNSKSEYWVHSGAVFCSACFAELAIARDGVS